MKIYTKKGILIFLFISILALSINQKYQKETNNLKVVNKDFVTLTSSSITSSSKNSAINIEKKNISDVNENEIKKILQTDRTTLIKNYNLVVNGGELGGMDGYIRLEGSSISDYIFMLPIRNLLVCIEPPSDFKEETIQRITEVTPYMIVVMPDKNILFLNKFTSSCTLEQARQEINGNKETSYYAIDDPNIKEGNFLFWENNGLCYQFVFPYWNNNKLNEIRIWLQGN